jgi:cis-3-alkyl-4-acyloxetan-2-one decarboxylase / olefin beta-lactone synthetase
VNTPPPGLTSNVFPGLDPAWSTFVRVADSTGTKRSWHVLDNAVADPIGTLLCVHGNPTWSYLWRRLLEHAPQGWRVVAPDHLGMGYSDRLTSLRTLAQRVDDLSDLTAALDITGPVVTVGHDWGGAISLGWAVAHRSQLHGVVLTNTAIALPAGDSGPALIRLAHAPLLRDALCRRTPIFVGAATALSRPPLPRDVRRAFAAPYDSAARRRSVRDFVADIPFSRDHPSRATLEGIAADVSSISEPVLLLWGPRDPVFGEKYLADLRQRLPQAQLHRYEGASHLVTEDAPQYTDAVAQWLADLTIASSERAIRTECAVASGAIPATPPSPTNAGSGSAPRYLWSALDARADDLSPAVVEVAGANVSWAALSRRVQQLAAGLTAAGLRRGDRVALLLPPSADLTAVVYAVWRAGAVIVVADKGLGFAGMRRALRSASVDFVVAGPQGLVAARLMGLPGSRIAAGHVPGAAAQALGVDTNLADLLHRGGESPLPPEPSAEDDCAVVFTSGATGAAKGVVYRHLQALAQIELVRSTYALSAQDRIVAAFAPFALLGPALGIGSAVPDIDVTAPASLTASALADAASAVEATVIFASPAALRTVVSTGAALSSAQRSALARVRLVMSAGAPVAASLLRELNEVLPAAEPHTPYGMTEALPVTDISLAGIDAAGRGDGVCVGRPLEGVQLAVSPLTTTGVAEGHPTWEPDVTGEVCVRARHIKDRYDALWATERASSRDAGWHRTGDVGHLDRQGRLWIEGRLAHVITTADGVVTPVAIEQRIERLVDVDSAAVVGVGPPGAQVVVVVVVPLSSRPRRGFALASTTIADAVREAAAVDVAAVLVARRLPLDIRHASKIDRLAVARSAGRLLAGTTVRGPGFRMRTP